MFASIVAIIVPLWAVCLYAVAFLSLLLWLVLELMTRPKRRPKTLEEVQMILQDADADCPPCTPASGLTWQSRAVELDAQRVYWKNAFISWVKREL